jgi:pimeloyl-ACP methyl ester carboxylesterase
MARLSRPDGVEIAWEPKGEGPTVVITTAIFATRDVPERLIDDLSRDHAVASYDPRGTGDSTRRGPYDTETDVGDLEALVEVTGAPAVLIGIGNFCECSVLLASRRPELVTAVIVPFGNPGGIGSAKGTEALVASSSVIEAFSKMLATDYRGALHQALALGNPNMSEEEVSERVERFIEYCSQDVAESRLEAWLDVRAVEAAQELGGRLWVLQHRGNPWFPEELLGPMRELFPEAHIEEVADGHISRPDITAAVVRRVTHA